MHPNPLFRAQGSDAEQRALMEALVSEIGFGMIFAQTPNGPRVGQVSLFSTGDGAVQFHLARGNGLTKSLPGSDALIVVNGPDAYVSPDWYDGPDQVPTWNYISIELEGPVRAMDEDGLIALLDDLSAANEAKLAPKPAWTRDKMDDGLFRKMLGGITGFEMEVKAWRPTFKLSQNKTEAERHRVADELEKQGKKAMAHFMREWVK
jgi:transcriptional regulator